MRGTEIYKNKKYCSKLKTLHDTVGKKLAQEIMNDMLKAKLITENTKEDRGDFTDGFWDQKYRLPKGEEVKVEPEMKDKKWWGNKWSTIRPFKYDTVDIPFRKKKNQADIHIVISTCNNFAFLVTRCAMDKALEEEYGGTPIIKTTIYEPEGAPYYRTPVERGRFVWKDTNGRWHLYKRF